MTTVLVAGGAGFIGGCVISHPLVIERQRRSRCCLFRSGDKPRLILFVE